MRCSSDIRKRVIGFVKAGGSKTEAARRFDVSAGRIISVFRVISYRYNTCKS